MYNRDNTEIHTWFERDRSHVELRCTETNKTIVEWWDDDCLQAFEDGYLPDSAFILGSLYDETAIHIAAIEYANDRGMKLQN